MLADERLDEIEALVSANLNDDCVPAKGGVGAVNARVYAVKANCNRLLDVARETYKENVGDIYQLSRTVSEEHSLPLTLVYKESGFVFALKKADLDGELPKGFLNVTFTKGRWMFTSMELKKMNARMKDALDETMLLSDKIIQDLVAGIVALIGALYKASEAVSFVPKLGVCLRCFLGRPRRYALVFCTCIDHAKLCAARIHRDTGHQIRPPPDHGNALSCGHPCFE